MPAPRYRIVNAPDHELNRSPAAQVVGALAARSELFLTHFEHRHHLSPPSYWLPEDRPDLDGEVRWARGELKEHKFLHFRYDQPLGSLHPSHRAKWTAHELCHGLVGFAWSPTMTPFTQTLVARLAELLPVTLWYFYDEAQLRRCPLHYLQGALFQDHCVYCERLAEQGARLAEREDAEWVERGVKFLRAELAAVARSRRYRRPLPHRFATLDLNSDAMAFTAQNLQRMEDPYFRYFCERFHGPHTGMWSDLDALEGRVLGLSEALTGGLPAPPLTAGRARWVAQDLAWRLLTVAAQCEDREASDTLEGLVEGLAERPEDVGAAVRGYEELFEEFFIPTPAQVFAVGYDLGGGYGSDAEQLTEGVLSACPGLELALGREGVAEQVRAFASWDLARPQRVSIARRFARFLAETGGGPLSDLAAYEAAVADPEPPDPWAACLAWRDGEGDLVRRAQGVEVVRVGVDVDRMLEALRAQEEGAEGAAELDVPERSYDILVVNRAGGLRHIAELTPNAARALAQLQDGPIEGALLGLTVDEWGLLKDLGAITPCAWLEERRGEGEGVAVHEEREGLSPEARLASAVAARGDGEDDVSDEVLPDALWFEPGPPAPEPVRVGDVSIDVARAPLNSFEAALQRSLRREEPPPAPDEPSQYEELFVFKGLGDEDDE